LNIVGRWQLIATEYDDGGFSGGTMERPALKKLMADIAAKRIDTVVVYKVDRLTGSLMDSPGLWNNSTNRELASSL
jgi:DNA invertase Pin-like site-specific DNA recombinase